MTTNPSMHPEQKRQSPSEREEMASLVLDRLEAFVFVKDAERRFVYASPHMCRVFKRPLERMRGCRDEDIMRNEKQLMGFRKDDELVLKGEVIQLTLEEVDVPNATPDQTGGFSTRTVATYKQRIETDTGEFRIFGYATDITDIKWNLELSKNLLIMQRSITKCLSKTRNFETIFSDAASILKESRLIRDCVFISEVLTPSAAFFTTQIANAGTKVWQDFAIDLEKVDVRGGQAPDSIAFLRDIQRRRRDVGVDSFRALGPQFDKSVGVWIKCPNQTLDGFPRNLIVLIELNNENHGLNFLTQSSVSQLVEWGACFAETLLGTLDRIRASGQALAAQERLVQAAKLCATKVFSLRVAHSLRRQLGKHQEEIRKLRRNDLLTMHGELNSFLSSSLTLVDQVHAFSEDAMSEFIQLDKKPVLIANVVEAVIANMSPKASQMRCDFEVDINQLRSVFVYGCETELCESLQILIDNAIEAKARRVRVEGCTRDASIELWVIDDGIGIPQKDRENVKKPRFTRNKRNGHGLGLMIADLLISDHQGNLELESLGKAGGEQETRWLLRLPRYSPEKTADDK